MKCPETSALIVDSLSDSLSPDQAGKLDRHLESCAACQAEFESLRQVWDGLGRLADEVPSAALSQRFYTMLGAYQQGMRAESRLPSWPRRLAAWIDGWWPRRPALQFAFTATALIVGIALGSRLTPATSRAELFRLEGEVASLRSLVSLSLLEQDSASERLRGVSISQRAEDPDQQVLAALVRVLNEDRNVNVRLAAIDALGRFADRATVLEDLRAALPRQTSPHVQLALAELLLQVDGPETRTLVDEWLARTALDSTVRGYIEQRLRSPI